MLSGKVFVSTSLVAKDQQEYSELLIIPLFPACLSFIPVSGCAIPPHYHIGIPLTSAFSSHSHGMPSQKNDVQEDTSWLMSQSGSIAGLLQGSTSTTPCPFPSRLMVATPR